MLSVVATETVPSPACAFLPTVMLFNCDLFAETHAGGPGKIIASDGGSYCLPCLGPDRGSGVQVGCCEIPAKAKAYLQLPAFLLTHPP